MYYDLFKWSAPDGLGALPELRVWPVQSYAWIMKSKNGRRDKS
jgi:hypothetical protein